MKNILIMVFVGVGLFVATTVGLLASKGRLNHEGTKGIPVLHGFFPKEEKDAGKDGEHVDAEHKGEAEGKVDPHGDDSQDGHDAAHGEGADESGQETEKLPYKTGKSVLKPEAAAGGHGEGDSHGEDAHGEAKGGHGKGGKPDQKPKKAPTEMTASEREWARRRTMLEKQHPYPDGLFNFKKLEPDVSAEQVNILIQRVNQKAKKLDQELATVQKMRSDLLTQLQDVKARQEDVSKQMQRVVTEREKLNRRIREFEKSVVLVRQDELEGLKQNAKNIEALEPETAKELILSWWNSGKEGQERALKTLSVMKKDSVDQILAAMTTEKIREILDRRLSIARVQGAKKE